MRLIVRPPAARHLATLVSLVVTFVACLPGTEALGSSNASAATETIAALHASEASECASQAVGPVSDSFKLAACTDLDSDLVAIGKLLSLPVLAPTLVTSPVELEVSDSPDPNAPSAYMETQFFSAGLTSVEPCKVIIYPIALKLDPTYQTETSVSAKLHVLLTHEAVHCYQNTVMSFDEQGGNDSTTIPQWISEGSATYIATLSLHSPEPASDSFWKNGWLGTPNKELIARSYDAVGWYSVVARATGNDLIGKFVSAWQAFVDSGYNNDAYIKALGGDVPAVEAAWAPSLLNAPQWGDAWATPGIEVPPDAQPTTVNDTIAAEDVPFSVQIAPYGAVVDRESTVTDGLVEVSIDNGLASVHDLASTDELDFTDQVFCVGKACDDAEVTCQHPPSANAPDHITPIPLTVPFYVAAGGSAQMGTLTMENMSVPTPDTPVSLPNDAGPCDPAGPKPPGPAGFSEGDPHIRTLDGGSYDFQGAGEYTLVRSASGDVNVQVRAQPFEGVMSSVAYNSAVAAKVGSSVIEVDAGDPSVLRVNGNRVTTPIHGARALGSGTDVGHLTESVDGSITDVVVTWPDGSELDVSAGELGIDATFVPPATPVDTYSGLLSALVLPKGKATDVVATPTVTLLGGDGHTYVINPTTAAGFKKLYGPFARSWQVTPTTSLFTYPKGKTTRSFDIKEFPHRVVTTSSLTPAEKRKAKVACTAAGITGAVLLNDCIIDVGETGKKSFATATAREQAKVSAASTTTTTSPPGPPSASTTTTTTTTAPVGGSHPASYYLTHPCSVVTQSEIAQAVGSESAAPAASEAVCTFRPNGSAAVDSVTFSSQSAGLFEDTHTGQSGSGPVPSLGHGAYCIVSPPYVSGQSYVVASLGAAGSIQVLAGNCTQGTALVKDALARISGQ
jgi:hypothetical protein